MLNDALLLSGLVAVRASGPSAALLLSLSLISMGDPEGLSQWKL